MSDDVLFSVNQNGAAAIVLNRPKALNSSHTTWSV